MLPAAQERIPPLTSGDEIFSLAAGVAPAALDAHQGTRTAQGKKPHQGILSSNRRIGSGATWPKWPGTHQDSGRPWPTTVLGIALDANGNTLSDATGKQYTWAFENRLTQAVVPGTGGGTTTFKYDPFGRRIQKSGPLGTTNYLYDGFQLIEEVDPSGNVFAKYSEDQGIDEPLAGLISGTTNYYQRDALNSVTSVSSAAATLANTYNFDSFGKLTASTGTLASPFQFTGREFDQETGLYFNRARYYDSNTGRFVTEDPLGFDAGVNFYDYVLNDPVDNVDPFGWKTCTTRIMLVTAYCSRGPGSNWPHYKPRKKGGKPSSVGPGDIAVANSDPQPYPYGCSVSVTDIANGTTDYTGTTNDTGAGWDAAHHDVLPGAWIDIWMPCRKARNYGTRYRTVTICCDCPN